VPRTRSTGRRLTLRGGTADRDYAFAGVVVVELALFEAAPSLFAPPADSDFVEGVLSTFVVVFESVFESVFVSLAALEDDPLSELTLGRLSVLYQPDPLNTIPAGNSTLRT
jgi:hypothetical protein